MTFDSFWKSLPFLIIQEKPLFSKDQNGDNVCCEANEIAKNSPALQ
jgi:hypothetical protein